MKNLKLSRKFLALFMTLAIAMSLQVSAVLAETASAQGYDQTLTLCEPSTGANYGDVEVLQQPSPFLTANEGQQYYLTRVNDVYDINNDVQILVKISAGVNNLTAARWNDNGMRYMSVLDATTGEVVANWTDDETLDNGKNSTGNYQILHELSNKVSGGVLHTIPKEALEESQSYFVVFGSATCGQNPSRMLYAPVIYLITMSDENGDGIVNTTINSVGTNSISIEYVTSDPTLTTYFNRFSFSPNNEYASGIPFTTSVPGQEICVIPPENYTIVVYDANDELVPISEFINHGGSGGGTGGGTGNMGPDGWGDIRFTMPNEAVTIVVQ